MLQKLKKLFKKDTDFIKVTHVYGELVPGHLDVDISLFNPNKELLHTKRISASITSRMRHVVNRLLAGQHTQNDEEVLNLYVRTLKDSKF